MPDAPVLLVVDDDLRKREAVEGELRKRYGSDYEVVSVGSAADALRLLRALRDDRRELGLVLAGQWMRALTGTGLSLRRKAFVRQESRGRQLLRSLFERRNEADYSPAGTRP
jgi:CheY-like chemotaxis protein